jgi:hypothetical protein
MRLRGISVLIVLVVASTANAQSRSGAIRDEEVEYQSQCFERWWGTELVWKFDDLPKEGVIGAGRLPYSGYIYPDGGGGTTSALRKYDSAFHRGGYSATSFEQRDISMHKEARRYGLFRRRVRYQTPHWHGHCNGWTAAAIRHAEPQNNVVRNGVTFTPADIKGLLAEVYMYTDTEFLGGIDTAINPGTFHVVLTNWLGRGKHPIGMDSTVGEEVWNFPIYSYAYWADEDEERQRVEVKMNIAFVDASPREYNKAPHRRRTMYFHYMLNLDDDGKVVGGNYMGGNRIDMLWAPLKPIQGGEKGNEAGNPHLDVKQVLAIWRESVPEEKRSNWFNIDPTDEDRIPESQLEALAGAESEPGQEDNEVESTDLAVAATSTSETTEADAESDSDDDEETVVTDEQPSSADSGIGENAGG